MKIEAPLHLHNESVQADWIDYNGHMNLAYYVLIFDHATDAFLDYIGMTAEFRDAHHASTFAAELHVTYHKEVGVGDEVSISTQLLGFDDKRIHYFHSMHQRSDGSLVATNELMSLYMNMQQRRVSCMPGSIRQNLLDIESAHSQLAVPEQLGSVIALRKKKGQSARS